MNKYKIEETLSNIQFQVYSNMNFIEPLGLDKETWKELLEYIDKYKEVLDKIKEYAEKYKIIGVIAPEENEYMKHILELLEEIE